MDLEPRRQFGQQLPGDFLGTQWLEDGRIRLAPHQLFRLNDLQDARSRLQQEATVLGFHQDTTRQFNFAPVAPHRDMFQRTDRPGVPDASNAQHREQCCECLQTTSHEPGSLLWLPPPA